MMMHAFLFSIFSMVCGENPQHIWAPGGEALPCCERCTGLYIGALVAIGLRLGVKPPGGRNWLRIHTFFLLQLGLFVFAWMPQSPMLRTISGALFGSGVVAFLWPAVSDRCSRFRVSCFGDKTYALGLAICLAVTPMVAEWGGLSGAYVLTGLVAIGAVALVVLAGVNLVLCLSCLLPKLRNPNERGFLLILDSFRW